MVEEDVDELPQNVVERFDELLADERVGRGRLELPLRAAVAETDRQASPGAGERERAGRLSPVVLCAESHRNVITPREQLDLRLQVAALAGQAESGQRPLAHDHRMDELDRDVTRIRARRRRSPECDQTPAAGKALGHQMAQTGQPLGLGLKEPSVGLGALLEQRREPVRGDERVAHTGAPCRAAIRRATPATRPRPRRCGR